MTNSTSSAATAPTSAASAAAPSSAAASSAAPSASASGVQDLPVDDAIRSQLLTAFAAGKNIPPSDIASSRPGSTYYAYDPATGTYWAMSTYTPASGVPLNVQVSFQDGGATGLFKKTSSGTWQATTGGLPNICAELKFFPKAVLAAWSLPTTPDAQTTC